MLRFLFWPFKEVLRFFAMLWLLVTFTSIGNFVDGRGMTLHVIEKAVYGWNQVRLYVSEASAKVNASTVSDTGNGTQIAPAR